MSRKEVIELVDIHTHVLPYMDDGARNTQESVDMLLESYKQGTRLCVATPHCTIHQPVDIENFLIKRKDKYNVLADSIANLDVPKVILGAEVLMDNDISVYPNIKDLCIGDTDYMLIEFPIDNQNLRLSEWLYSLSLRGIKPIIAHVERYPNFEKLFSEFSGLNLIYQINDSNFLNFYRRRIIKYIFKNHDAEFIVATDMHNTSNRRCNILPAYEIAQKKFPDIAEDIFKNNSLKLFSTESMAL